MELHLLSLPPTTGTPGISLLDIIFVSADPNRNSTLSPKWICFGAWEVIVFDDSQSTLICTKWALLLALPSHLSILNIYIWHWDVNTVKTTTPYLTSSTKPLHCASYCHLRPSATKIFLFSNSRFPHFTKLYLAIPFDSPSSKGSFGSPQLLSSTQQSTATSLQFFFCESKGRV